MPAVLFGIAANIFYTSGWVVEGLYLHIWGMGSPGLGPRLFKAGLAFSLVLASLPGLILAIEVVVKKVN